MMKISLMLCTYNRLDLTKRMLQDLQNSTKESYTLYIVDDGSTDGTREFLKNYALSHSNIEVHENEKNVGIAHSRNTGLKLAAGSDWYVTIDNDVELPLGWLTECIDILKANRAYGAIGVNMENKPYPIVNSGGFRFQDKPAGNLGTACMVFPKTTHQLLGYFNTEYGKYGEEDADFGMRMRVSGLKLGYIERMGTHFGDGELDKGEYREFKTKCHRDNLRLFNANCAAYFQRKKSLYIPYKAEE